MCQCAPMVGGFIQCVHKQLQDAIHPLPDVKTVRSEPLLFCMPLGKPNN